MIRPNPSYYASLFAGDSHPVLDILERERLIPILRTNTADDALWAARCLMTCGLHVLEITYTIPQAALVIRELMQEFPNALIGAGTVMDIRTATDALAAGARFLVSPVTDESLIQFCIQENILIIPGVWTPSEIYRAGRMGVQALKLFPAEQAGGPAYLKALLTPMPHLKIIPTGGVHADNFIAYLEAGGMAVGIGSHLLPAAIVDERNEKEVDYRLNQYLKRLRQFQNAPL